MEMSDMEKMLEESFKAVMALPPEQLEALTQELMKTDLAKLIEQISNDRPWNSVVE